MNMINVQSRRHCRHVGQPWPAKWYFISPPCFLFSFSLIILPQFDLTFPRIGAPRIKVTKPGADYTTFARLYPSSASSVWSWIKGCLSVGHPLKQCKWRKNFARPLQKRGQEEAKANCNLCFSSRGEKFETLSDHERDFREISSRLAKLPKWRSGWMVCHHLYGRRLGKRASADCHQHHQTWSWLGFGAKSSFESRRSCGV